MDGDTWDFEHDRLIINIRRLLSQLHNSFGLWGILTHFHSAVVNAAVLISDKTGTNQWSGGGYSNCTRVETPDTIIVNCHCVLSSTEYGNAIELEDGTLVSVYDTWLLLLSIPGEAIVQKLMLNPMVSARFQQPRYHG